MKSELCDRITNYLSMGGLINPEMALHEKVRDLLIDCRAALSLSSPIEPCSEPTRGSIEWLRRLHEPPPVPTSLWPKDLTVCQKCKRDMLTNRHAVDIWGEVVCLPNVSWKEQVEKEQASTPQASSEIQERMHQRAVRERVCNLRGLVLASRNSLDPDSHTLTYNDIAEELGEIEEALTPSRQGAGGK